MTNAIETNKTWTPDLSKDIDLSTGDAEADEIVRRHTACDCYYQLAGMMERGYVPTVSKRRQGSLLVLLMQRQHTIFVVR